MTKINLNDYERYKVKVGQIKSNGDYISNVRLDKNVFKKNTFAYIFTPKELDNILTRDNKILSRDELILALQDIARAIKDIK